MKWKEYFIVMKNAGLSWLGHLMPFAVVVAFKLQFTKAHSTFNNKPCQYSRFGNSGLFLVFSEEIQEKLKELRRKSDEWDRQEEEEQERKEFEKLKGKFA